MLSQLESFAKESCVLHVAIPPISPGRDRSFDLHPAFKTNFFQRLANAIKIQHAFPEQVTILLHVDFTNLILDIAHLLKVSDDYVRDVIHAFNERGFDALDPKMERGSTEEDR